MLKLGEKNFANDYNLFIQNRFNHLKINFLKFNLLLFKKVELNGSLQTLLNFKHFNL